jgi:hypothetical protein
MSTGEIFGAALVAWKADTRCSTGHAAGSLVLARPSTALNTWSAGLMAF